MLTFYLFFFFFTVFQVTKEFFLLVIKTKGKNKCKKINNNKKHFKA